MNFDEIIDRRNTNSAKFDEMERKYGPGLYHLGVADMDFRSPEPIREAMEAIVQKGVFGYTVLPENYQALVADWMARRYRAQVNKDWVVFSPRVNMALNMMVEIFSGKSDGILLHSPAYTALTAAIDKLGRTRIDLPLRREGDSFFMDFEAMERAVDEFPGRVSMLLFCNPHNPTGRVWSGEELDRLVSFCAARDILLVSDEIHADFVRSGYEFCSILTGREDVRGLIVCNAVTKSLNVPGVILSNVIVPDEARREQLRGIIDCWGLHNPNIFAAGILEPAYTRCEDWLEAVNAYIEGNARLLAEYFEAELPGLRPMKSEGTYLAWVDFSETGLTPEALERRLLEHGVEVYMGARYSDRTSHYIRINLGTSRAYLREALRRIKAALN